MVGGGAWLAALIAAAANGDAVLYGGAVFPSAIWGVPSGVAGNGAGGVIWRDARGVAWREALGDCGQRRRGHKLQAQRGWAWGSAIQEMSWSCGTLQCWTHARRTSRQPKTQICLEKPCSV